MIISLNWLKKYTDIDLSPNELAELIGARLVEIEEVINLEPRYERIVVAEIKRTSDHANADKLGVYFIDDGGVIDDVVRLEDGLVQVVSGDKALRVGDKVAWLAPGSTVPSTYTSANPMKLEPREMRGEMSYGMLGSGKELEINHDGDRVQVLDTNAPNGTSFAKVYELDDYLLDIANKSLTHRPDTFGIIGFAREVAAIQGKPFQSPAWYLATDPVLAEIAGEKVDVDIEISEQELCDRYQAVVLKNVSVGRPSPLTIQSYLSRVGVRPLNAAVDVTNYLMVVTGQPLHAFDYDKLLQIQGGEKPKIVVRSARENEPLKLLDGRTITLQPGDIVICAGDTPVALAGVMGGADTEISDQTKSILLESATFNLYNIRATTMRHGIFSDAAMRFTKGQAASQTAPVLASAVRMLSDVSGGQRASKIVEAYPGNAKPSSITVDADSVNATLGADLSADEIAETLRLAEFSVEVSNDELSVTAPYWRADIHIVEDIAEEIGRLRGFDNIEPKLPLRDMRAVTPEAYDVFRAQLRKILARAGANEALTYSFVHGDLFSKTGQDSDKAFRLTNAISPELQYYRLSLLPSLMDKAYANLRQGYGEFAMFEINKVHSKDAIDEDDTPSESHRLALMVVADDKTASDKYVGAPYYQVKRFLSYLCDSLKINLELKPFEDGVWDKQASRVFEPRRSAVLLVKGQAIGVIGEPKTPLRRELKLPNFSAGFELDLQGLFGAYTQAGKTYRKSSRYPGTTQDVCFKVSNDVTYESVANIAQQIVDASDFEGTVEPVDIYAGKESGFKQVTIRVALVSFARTITTTEASELVSRIAAVASKQLGAAII